MGAGGWVGVRAGVDVRAGGWGQDRRALLRLVRAVLGSAQAVAPFAQAGPDEGPRLDTLE
jgi:hypothetical protein